MDASLKQKENLIQQKHKKINTLQEQLVEMNNQEMSYEDQANKIGIRNLIKETKARVEAQKLQKNESIRSFISK